jgi:hypothetical protein
METTEGGMKRNHLIAAGVAILLLALAGYFASPLLALHGLRDAMKKGDPDRLEQLVDFPRVREGLKADMTAMMIAQMQSDPEMRDNPFAAIGLAIAPGLVNNMVDAVVTPATFSRLASARSFEAVAAETPQPDAPAALRPAATPAPAPTPHQASIDEAKYAYAYAGLNRFRATAQDGPTLMLDRNGLFSWRLVKVEFPPDFMKTR